MFGLDQINAAPDLYLAIGCPDRAGRRCRSTPGWPVRRGDPSLGPGPSVAANVAQRLIQVHMCIIYFFAGTSKLQGEAWWNGQALWRALSNLEYQSFDMTWLAWYPRLVNLVTHVTVLWEVSFCVLIWVPRLRPLVLACGRGDAPRDRRVPGDVDLRADHALRPVAFLPNEWAQRAGARRRPPRPSRGCWSHPPVRDRPRSALTVRRAAPLASKARPLQRFTFGLRTFL